MTWHVEQAHTPPQAWSNPILKPSEMSKMLPGRPLCPYGIFSGSTSIVLPLGRNVTLYFFVAGLYLTSSMYGFVPPIIPPKTQTSRGATKDDRPCWRDSNLGQLAPFQGGRNRAAHQQFRQVLGRVIQLVNAFANEFVVAARHRLLERNHTGINPRAFFGGQALRLRIRQRLGGRGQNRFGFRARLNQLAFRKILLGIFDGL